MYKLSKSIEILKNDDKSIYDAQFYIDEKFLGSCSKDTIFILDAANYRTL